MPTNSEDRLAEERDEVEVTRERKYDRASDFSILI